MVKKGDTLVEVTLAVGIFSMIAVAVVAIMSNGTSETQTALETTLTREEIDTQAEALRFIQSSAAAENPSNSDDLADSPFSSLWESIKGQAISFSGLSTDTLKKAIYQYAPKDCRELYDKETEGNIFQQHAFIIDVSNLGNGGEDSLISSNNSETTGKFITTSTYPRVEDSWAEGIFVVGTKSQDGNSKPYYDFYIRTCWYGANADKPSTISTVIRLLDV